MAKGQFLPEKLFLTQLKKHLLPNLRIKKKPAPEFLEQAYQLCPGLDSNQHTLSGATTSK